MFLANKPATLTLLQSPQKGDIQNCYVNTGQHAEIQNVAGDGELSKQLSSTVAVSTKQANHLNLQRYCHSATSVIASSITLEFVLRACEFCSS